MVDIDDALAKKVKAEKEEDRATLRKFPKFALKRDLFFIHGWSDEDNVCWTCSYDEIGKDAAPDWEYTIKDWIDKLITNKDERVHYVKLVYAEENIKHRYEWGQIKLDIETDETFEYENFFQFAELLKYKITLSRSTEQIDLICHSMGGLDSVAAIAADKEQDATGTIYHSPIQGVNQLITVSTPHQGSPAANLSDTELAKVLLRQSEYIRTQGSNMRPTSDFIKLVNDVSIRNQLLDRVSFMHMFGGGSDIVVPTSNYMIKTTGLKKSNYKVYPTLSEATHSQAMGITQDPRMSLSIFKLLQS